MERGEIPFRLRIGVTGQRRLDNEDALVAPVRLALARLRELLPSSAHTPVFFTVVSPLAEGADRLVAQEALKEPNTDLEVPLPLPREDYLRDFESDTSKREFADLVTRAREVVELGPFVSREDAYEGVGRYVVDRCDVLLALWDGQPSAGQGGTAEIIAYAEKNHVPLLWINTGGQHEIVELSVSRIGGRPYQELDDYNRGRIAPRLSGEQSEREQRRLLAAAEQSAVQTPSLRPLLDWMLPYFTRADLAAQRYQTMYHVLGDALFLLTALAVAIVAGQALFVPQRPQLVWIEVGLMLALLLILGAGRRWRFHERWISYRFLAERFRSAFFLALVGLGARREGSPEWVQLGHPSEEWLRRAFAEVWNSRPRVDMAESDAEGLKRFLAKAWIEDQARFHSSTSAKYQWRHVRLGYITALLFVATFSVALLHAVGVGGDSSAKPLSWSNLLIFLAISMPALGAALSGIRAEREYLRNSERYGRMVHYLEDVGRRISAATNFETIRECAAQAENLMLEENRDWFLVMKFHDFELHV
jgi:putative Ca2+/H+ antiporter (TMEM165/GDT1 family)